MHLHMGISGARAGAATAATVLLLGIAACGDDEVDLPAATDPSPAAEEPSPTPGLDLTAEEQEAVDEALATVDAYFGSFVRLAIEGVDVTTSDHHDELGPYGTAPDDYHFTTLDNYAARDHYGSGTIDWELITVVEVDADGSTTNSGNPRVTVRLCFDETDWTVVDEAGEVVSGPGDRRPATIPISYSEREYSTDPGPRWRLSTWEFDEGETC